MPESLKIRIEQGKQVVNDYEGKIITEELDRNASISELKSYLDVRDNDVK
jgi:hypothetical protein